MELIVFYILMSLMDEKDEELVKQSSVCLKSQYSEEDLIDKVKAQNIINNFLSYITFYLQFYLLF